MLLADRRLAQVFRLSWNRHLHSGAALHCSAPDLDLQHPTSCAIQLSSRQLLLESSSCLISCIKKTFPSLFFSYFPSISPLNLVPCHLIRLVSLATCSYALLPCSERLTVLFCVPSTCRSRSLIRVLFCLELHLLQRKEFDGVAVAFHFDSSRYHTTVISLSSVL